ncbi:hypothetical protein EQG49_05580 [Periweissella cryptocerci]|uniref:Uncharacterized protein n=1 Tax=Periweissella cryptocerci TaxID=2506420 RepID=A0A4P6YTF7_9LACO|nr:hypothetical protein [Periweissella cryptocerci]QBO35966.1 hypothetical protein EQG49_05580 [Periweissella cryptocerci]
MISEINKLLNLKNILITIALILIMPVINLIILTPKNAYTNYYQFFLDVTGNVVALSFPLIITVVYAVKMTNEKRNSYLAYVQMRTELKKYYLTKLKVAALIGFGAGFLYVFIPTIFTLYLAPQMGLVYIDHLNPQMTIFEPFNTIVNLGKFPFIFIYSLWLGINGVAYSVLAQLLVLRISNIFVAFFSTTILYVLFELLTQAIPFLNAYSPINTLFPYSSTVNIAWWVLLVPLLLIILSSTILSRGILNAKIEI